jgi:hypothetical protein
MGTGNATPAAEFNFWSDPETADTLLASNLPITLLPLLRRLNKPINLSSRAADMTRPVTPDIWMTGGSLAKGLMQLSLERRYRASENLGQDDEAANADEPLSALEDKSLQGYY